MYYKMDKNDTNYNKTKGKSILDEDNLMNENSKSFQLNKPFNEFVTKL